MQVTPLMTGPTWPTTRYGALDKDLTVSENIKPPEIATTEKDVTLEKPWLKEPGYTGIDNMRDYLSGLRIFAYLELQMMKWSYDSFDNDLAKENPELAEKNFGFSIDRSGRINILDPDESLSEEEVSCLTQRLEQCDGLQRGAREITQIIKLIAKYDKAEFGQYQNLNPGALAESLDYRAIFRSEDMAQTWRSQLHQHAQTQVQTQRQTEIQAQTQSPSISEVV